MTERTTLDALLADTPPARPALRALDGRAPLSHGALRGLMARTVAALNARGIGRGDRVAIVLPNGPEMAAVFLAVAAGAATAPLNPAYRGEEFEFYLDDLKAKALLVLAGWDTPARAAAARLGVPVIEVVPSPSEGAGRLHAGGRRAWQRGPAGRGGGGRRGAGAAHLRHHGAAEDRAADAGQRHRLGAAHRRGAGAVAGRHLPQRHAAVPHPRADRGVLSSLGAGGAVVCTPASTRCASSADGRGAPDLVHRRPTMHQAILSRAERNREIIDRVKLRFLRSSSASLPGPVMQQLETVFGAPLVESYGMTEAAHQMASNPLEGPRKPGHVGRPAGPEMAIMGEDGAMLPQGEIGEVVIRGPNVTAGYEANPEANAKAFTDGWFRTGDQGLFDRDGFLLLTGRLKELINRGGEKVSPLEVDGVLSAHPAVAQALCFAIPHAKLGEEVGAAIVLREGHEASERELRDFAAIHLADFKVPRRMVFLAEIPKGATGKLMRIGLAEKLGLVS
jgi:acyl-CoA synthetase (AMP-forming)/AMP-acid ligase II